MSKHFLFPHQVLCDWIWNNIDCDRFKSYFILSSKYTFFIESSDHHLTHPSSGWHGGGDVVVIMWYYITRWRDCWLSYQSSRWTDCCWLLLSSPNIWVGEQYRNATNVLWCRKYQTIGNIESWDGVHALPRHFVRFSILTSRAVASSELYWGIVLYRKVVETDNISMQKLIEELRSPVLACLQ